MNKLEVVTEYVKNGGGVIQFHTLNELCLSTLSDKLTKVVECHTSKTHPFGVMDVEISEKELNLVYKYIIEK